MDTVFFGLRWLDIATIAAIILGPILAVAIDRVQQRWTDQKRRRLEIFRDLMKTRRHRLDPVHVGALNLIDLEFYGVRRVKQAFREYIKHLGLPPLSEGTPGWENFYEEREDLLTTLLYEIGTVLGYSYDKRDLGKLAYGPVGWNTDQNLQRGNLVLLNEILEGRRALPVTPMQPPPQNPFPPTPEIKS